MWHALCYHTHDLSPQPKVLAMFIEGMYLDVEKSSEGLYYGCKNKFEAMVSGHSGLRMCDPIFNQLIQDLLSLAQEHYKAIDLASLEKFRPCELLQKHEAVVDSHRKESTRTRKRPLFKKATIPANTAVPLPPANRTKPTRVLDVHTELGYLLGRYINRKDGWTGPGKIPDQLQNIPNLSFTYGKRAVVGTKTAPPKTSSSRKRRAEGVPVTKSRPKSKKSRTSASSEAVSLSSYRGLCSVQEESEGDDPESEEEA